MSSWQQPSEIRGRILALTPLRPEDAADFLDALGPPEAAAEVLQHLGPVYVLPMDRSAADRVIAAAIDDPDRWPFTQRLVEHGDLVGTTSFYEIDPVNRAVAIGHTWVGRPHWRTAVNTESKLLMLGYAFDSLGAERVVWHTDIANARSQHAIARLGAQREGVLRHHRIRRDGSWRDTVQYSMLAAEWPGARDWLTARLGTAG